MPYLSPRRPPALVAALPPIVETLRDPGSGIKRKPSLATSSSRSMLVTPGCTTAIISDLETSSSAFMLAIARTMPPCSGTVAPERLLPAPRAMIGVLVSFANFTTFTTSAVVRGETITSGAPRKSGVASRLYASSEVRSDLTMSAPRSAVSCSAIPCVAMG